MKGCFHHDLIYVFITSVTYAKCKDEREVQLREGLKNKNVVYSEI